MKAASTIDNAEHSFIERLLIPSRVFVYPTLFLIAMLVAFAKPIVTGHPPYDARGEPDGGDLTAKLTGGRIALAANMRHLYDVRTQRATQQELLGGNDHYELSVFVAPPFAAYLFVPFAVLPYLVGVVLWAAFSAAMVAASLWLLWPWLTKLHRYGYGRILLLAFASFPVFRLLETGQDAALCLFLFALGLRLLLARRDGAAGAVLALGLFKPQFFVLAPVLLLLQRRWRALGVWVAVAVALASISVALVGPAGVRAYLQFLRRAEFDQGGVLLDLTWRSPSLAAIARLANAFLPSPLGTLTGAVTVGLGIGMVVWWAWAALEPARNDRELTLLYVGMLLVGVVTSLHTQDYDLVILLLPAWILYQSAPESSRVRLLLTAAYVLTWGVNFVQPLTQDLPGPLPLLGAPWAVALIIGLFVVGQQLIQRTGVQSGALIQQVT